MSTSELYQTLAEKFPFMTHVKYGEVEHIGIVQNKDHHIITIYDYELIPNMTLRKLFIELGESWWWESNRLIPINIFLKDDFKQFKPYAKTFALKDITIIRGPIVNLNDINQKRVKSRTIQLIRRVTS